MTSLLPCPLTLQHVAGAWAAVLGTKSCRPHSILVTLPVPLAPEICSSQEPVPFPSIVTLCSESTVPSSQSS